MSSITVPAKYRVIPFAIGAQNGWAVVSPARHFIGGAPMIDKETGKQVDFVHRWYRSNEKDQATGYAVEIARTAAKNPAEPIVAARTTPRAPTHNQRIVGK